MGEADRSHLYQSLKFYSQETLQAALRRIEHIDISESQASFPEDKQMVLDKVSNIPLFNQKLKSLMLKRVSSYMTVGELAKRFVQSGGADAGQGSLIRTLLGI